jgi:hypothetical protein
MEWFHDADTNGAALSDAQSPVYLLNVSCIPGLHPVSDNRDTILPVCPNADTGVAMAGAMTETRNAPTTRNDKNLKKNFLSIICSPIFSISGLSG